MADIIKPETGLLEKLKIKSKRCLKKHFSLRPDTLWCHAVLLTERVVAAQTHNPGSVEHARYCDKGIQVKCSSRLPPKMKGKRWLHGTSPLCPSRMQHCLEGSRGPYGRGTEIKVRKTRLHTRHGDKWPGNTPAGPGCLTQFICFSFPK